MKRILNVIGWIVLFPLYWVFVAPYNYYCMLRGYRKKLSLFLDFGRVCIGGYSGKLRIGTTHANKDLLFESVKEGYNTIDDGFQMYEENRLSKYLLKMKVYDYQIDEDGYLHIKVFRNDKLIKKFKDIKEKVGIE